MTNKGWANVVQKPLKERWQIKVGKKRQGNRSGSVDQTGVVAFQYHDGSGSIIWSKRV